ANDLFEIIERGDVKTMSFGFIPIKWVDTENNKSRTLKEVALQEVSFGVPYAAYPETDSQAFIRKNIMKRTIDIENLNELLEKETLTEDEITQLQEFVSSINEIINKNKPSEPKEEAANEEQREDTPKENTSDDVKEDEQKEEVKQEIISLIDTLFEIEKEDKEETNE
ncbi:MAG: HK97 family phage prohead protease, partial [Endomicrobium sp.]|nr:HK97 family phage prohead protease [Endomicrobium sp.]